MFFLFFFCGPTGAVGLFVGAIGRGVGKTDGVDVGAVVVGAIEGGIGLVPFGGGPNGLVPFGGNGFVPFGGNGKVPLGGAPPGPPGGPPGEDDAEEMFSDESIPKFKLAL